MSYQQLHVGKVKLNGLAGICHHLLERDRVKTNPDINLARSQLKHSIENLSPENLTFVCENSPDSLGGGMNRA